MRRCDQISDPPQNLGEERYKFGKLFEKCQKCRIFDNSWDILNKMKDNLDQECVKGGLLSFQGKIETIAPDFSGKNDSVFLVLTLLFHLSLPKSGFPTQTKIIFLK